MNQMPFNMYNQPMMPNPNIMPYNDNNFIEQRLNTLEQKVQNLENKLNNIEKNINPTTEDNFLKYQSSMHMM